jgi:hypothetical protein
MQIAVFIKSIANNFNKVSIDSPMSEANIKYSYDYIAHPSFIKYEKNDRNVQRSASNISKAQKQRLISISTMRNYITPKMNNK